MKIDVPSVRLREYNRTHIAFGLTRRDTIRYYRIPRKSTLPEDHFAKLGAAHFALESPVNIDKYVFRRDGKISRTHFLAMDNRYLNLWRFHSRRISAYLAPPPTRARARG